MYAGDLFETKITEDWEDAADQTWATTLVLFTNEYGKFQRLLERAAQQKGYKSNYALLETPRTINLKLPDGKACR